MPGPAPIPDMGARERIDTRGLAIRWAAAIIAAAGVLCLINLLRLEFGPWALEALQIDELYFSACAARGLAIGDFPVAGCHDNKAPLIYFVHQLVQLASGPYQMAAVKMAAFAVVGLMLVQVAYLAIRCSGALAAVAAVGLVLLVMTGDATLFALKTETVGTVLVLAALVIFVQSPGTVGPLRWLSIGGVLGLAIMTKQTYALVVAIFVFYRLVQAERGALAPAFRDAVLCGTGAAAPVVGMVLWFAAHGQLSEALGNLVVYPMVYGSSAQAPLWKRVLWTAYPVLTTLAQAPLVAALCIAAIVSQGWRVVRPAAVPRSTGHDPSLLLIAITLSMFAVTLISPNYFPYHMLPAWVFMALLAGLQIGEFARLSRGAPWRSNIAWSSALVVAALMMAMSSWYSQAGRGSSVELRSDPARWMPTPGAYAYVLGMWPHFYAYNKLVPASNVMFPWALPGVPATWAYKPPAAGSLAARWLDWEHGQNVRRLQDDFRRTPPRNIVIETGIARTRDSSRTTDVLFLDRYLHDHCRPARTVNDARGMEFVVYDCGP